MIESELVALETGMKRKKWQVPSFLYYMNLSMSLPGSIGADTLGRKDLKFIFPDPHCRASETLNCLMVLFEKKISFHKQGREPGTLAPAARP